MAVIGLGRGVAHHRQCPVSRQGLQPEVIAVKKISPDLASGDMFDQSLAVHIKFEDTVDIYFPLRFC